MRFERDSVSSGFLASGFAVFIVHPRIHSTRKRYR
jgi:hypothetical protein